jgi:CHAT domain-containing protein
MLSPEFDILHLAIHGTGDLNKNFAASLFFKSESDSVNDGELHAYELYGLKLKASMAVLTACESGLGKGYKGEGMLSMASAFTYSGCENILMSLWKVNDQISINIMNSFYDHLEKGTTIDDALRLSKLAYLESADELTADPKVWATMVAYGSLDNVFNEDKGLRYKVIISITLLIILLFAVLKKNRL